MRIRRAIETDLPELLALMRELAALEGRADGFAVTEQVLLEQGFRRSPPDVHSFVAEREGDGERRLAGMVLYYFIRFTASARPTLFIDQLYVRDEERRRKASEQLMRRVAKEAVREGCDVVRWRIPPANAPSIAFFEGLGASATAEALDFRLPEPAFRKLVEG